MLATGMDVPEDPFTGVTRTGGSSAEAAPATVAMTVVIGRPVYRPLRVKADGSVPSACRHIRQEKFPASARV